MDEKTLEFAKSLIDFQLGINTYGNKIRIYEIEQYLSPVSSKHHCYDALPYDYRIEISRYYLDKYLNEFFRNFSYFKNGFNNSSDILEKIYSSKGFDCFVELIDKEDKEKFYNKENHVYKNENFHEIFLNRLYKHWDKFIKDDSENIQEAIDITFDSQLTGYWFYYNDFDQNFLRIYLEYLKKKGYKVNIFDRFKKKIKKLSDNIEKGISHYTKNYLFEILTIIFDFYNAVIDLYGEDNEKVMKKLQTTLDYIFKDLLNVERMGFMNTFLYTKYHNPNLRDSSYSDVKAFWEKFYNEDLNPTFKRIFIDSFIYTWNKSAIPKVRNSIKLIADLSNNNYHTNNWNYGFVFKNQKIFYKDLICNASDLKKSVKTILFTKAVSEEGGLYLGG